MAMLDNPNFIPPTQVDVVRDLDANATMEFQLDEDIDRIKAEST